MDDTTCMTRDPKPYEPDQAILFQTAAKLLHAPEFDLDLPPGAWRRDRRSRSYSGPSFGALGPRVFLSKRTRKFMIELPNGGLIEGGCKTMIFIDRGAGR